MFKTSNRFSTKGVEKPKIKIILGVITGAFWIISALILFIDAFIIDLNTVTTGHSLTSAMVIASLGDLVTPIYIQLYFTVHLITFFISFFGIVGTVLIGLSIRAKSDTKMWNILLLVGIIDLIVFSLTTTIIKIVMFDLSTSILSLISTILSLIAGILFFTVLPIEEVKAGLIIISVPLAYLGGAIAIVLLILLFITSLYGWIL